MWITEDNQLNSKGFCANEFDAKCLFEPDYSKNCHLYSFKNTLIISAEMLPNLYFSHFYTTKNINNERILNKRTLEQTAHTCHPEFISEAEKWCERQDVLKSGLAQLLLTYIYIYITVSLVTKGFRRLVAVFKRQLSGATWAPILAPFP